MQRGVVSCQPCARPATHGAECRNVQRRHGRMACPVTVSSAAATGAGACFALHFPCVALQRGRVSQQLTAVCLICVQTP